MNKRLKRLLTSAVSILLILSMLFLSSCALFEQGGKESPPTVDDGGSTDGSGTIGDIDGTGEDGVSPSPSEPPEEEPPQPDDSVFDEYELDTTENFIYSLIYADLTRQYSTFTGYVTLPSLAAPASADSPEEVAEGATEVYGISYVDYEEGYIDANGRVYFSAGFITFPNEPLLDEDTRAGLEIISLEEEYDDKFSYLYAYGTQDVHMHCVIDNKFEDMILLTEP